MNALVQQTLQRLKSWFADDSISVHVRGQRTLGLPSGRQVTSEQGYPRERPKRQVNPNCAVELGCAHGGSIKA